MDIPLFEHIQWNGMDPNWDTTDDGTHLPDIFFFLNTSIGARPNQYYKASNKTRYNLKLKKPNKQTGHIARLPNHLILAIKNWKLANEAI